jgi:hypothetical protein
VGKNVSSIDYGRGMEYGNDMVLLSRVIRLSSMFFKMELSRAFIQTHG